jgi:hypothetical protein
MTKFDTKISLFVARCLSFSQRLHETLHEDVEGEDIHAYFFHF